MKQTSRNLRALGALPQLFDFNEKKKPFRILCFERLPISSQRLLYRRRESERDARKSRLSRWGVDKSALGSNLTPMKPASRADASRLFFLNFNSKLFFTLPLFQVFVSFRFNLSYSYNNLPCFAISSIPFFPTYFFLLSSLSFIL